MFLKVSSPEGVVFEGNIKQITLPTENGSITILPQSKPLVSIVKPGIIEYIPSEDQTQLCKSNEFVFNKEKLSVSISKGFVFTDGKVVTVTTSCASKKPNQPIHTLQQMKQDCEVKLKKIKNQGSLEEIQEYVIKLEKINADIRLSEIMAIRN